MGSSVSILYHPDPKLRSLSLRYETMWRVTQSQDSFLVQSERGSLQSPFCRFISLHTPRSQSDGRSLGPRWLIGILEPVQVGWRDTGVKGEDILPVHYHGCCGTIKFHYVHFVKSSKGRGPSTTPVNDDGRTTRSFNDRIEKKIVDRTKTVCLGTNPKSLLKDKSNPHTILDLTRMGFIQLRD